MTDKVFFNFKILIDNVIITFVKFRIQMINTLSSIWKKTSF